MQIFSVEGNTQRLDGGAMFGNCPRALWARWAEPDDENRIRLACRAMLVRESSGRHVLLETGIGAFFAPPMRARFGVMEERHVLLESLDALGVKASDIDVIVLSHLHFDHAGGLLTPFREGKPHELAFPRASYVVSEDAWNRANAPHARDRASFIPELQPLLAGTGRLEVVEGRDALKSKTLGDGYRFTLSDGHTPGLLLTTVDGHAHGSVTFLGDLIPGAPWVHVPITMGYDRYPELLIDEKRALLERMLAEHGWLFFTHDPETAAARLAFDKGKYSAVDPMPNLAWTA